MFSIEFGSKSLIPVPASNELVLPILLFEASWIGDPSTIYKGVFVCDNDILKKLSGKPIGVFLGWNDNNIGINKLASPNKFFSYINLGVPVIVSGKLENIAILLK